MSDARRSIPENSAEALAGGAGITGVDLTGAARTAACNSRVGNAGAGPAGLVKGADALRQAYGNGIGLNAGQPTASAPSLVEAYPRWRQVRKASETEAEVLAGVGAQLAALGRQLDAMGTGTAPSRLAKAVPVAKPKPKRTPAADVEARAFQKSERKVRTALRNGATPSEAARRGHAHYVAHGGKLARPAWSRRVVQG